MPKLTFKQWRWIAITYFIYVVLFGWGWATAIVIAIGFHEYCHLSMAHFLGMPTQGFTMLPFVGGIAHVPYQGHKTLWRQVLVLIAGPIGGFAIAVAWFAIYLSTGSVYFGFFAFWMGIVNLFNLLPIAFLDGGQLMNAITFSFNRKVGLYLMCASTLIGGVGIFLTINWILSLYVLFLGFLICKREYLNQKFMEQGFPELCSSDFTNKPFPMNRVEIENTIILWVITFVVITIFCMFLYHLGLSNITLLQYHDKIGAPT